MRAAWLIRQFLIMTWGPFSWMTPTILASWDSGLSGISSPPVKVRLGDLLLVNRGGRGDRMSFLSYLYGDTHMTRGGGLLPTFRKHLRSWVWQLKRNWVLTTTWLVSLEVDLPQEYFWMRPLMGLITWGQPPKRPLDWGTQPPCPGTWPKKPWDSGYLLF